MPKDDLSALDALTIETQLADDLPALEEDKDDLSALNIIQPLPEIPEDISQMSPNQARSIMKQYEAQGEDSGLDIAEGIVPGKGKISEVYRKTYLKQGDVQPEPEFTAAEKKLYQEELQKGTSLISEFTEQLLPSETPWQTIPFEDLSTGQKIASTTGMLLHYGYGGKFIHGAAKGALSVGVPEAGKAIIAKHALGLEMSAVVSKHPKLYSAALKIVQDSPLLFTEGAMWGAIESGGDLDEMVKTGLAFTAAVPILGVAGAGAKKLFSPVGKKIAKLKPVKSIEKEMVAEIKIGQLDDEAVQVKDKIYKAAHQTASDIFKKKQASKLNRQNKELSRITNDYQAKMETLSGLKKGTNGYTKAKIAASKANKRAVKASQEMALVKKNAFYQPSDGEIFLDLSSGKMEKLAEKIFLRNLEKEGLDMAALQAYKPQGGWKKLIQKSEWFSELEEGLGFLGDIPMKLTESKYLKSHLFKEANKMGMQDAFKQLKKLGVKGEQVTEYLKYVHRKDGQVYWNPQGGKYGQFGTFDKFKGTEPSQEVKELLYKLRSGVNWGVDKIRDAGQKVGEISNYIGQKQKVATGGKKLSAMPKKSSLLKTRKKGLEEEAANVELDAYKWIPRVMRDSMNTAAYSKVLEEAGQAHFMAKALGKEGLANHLSEYVKRSLGMNSRVDAIRAISLESTRSAKQWLKVMGEGQDILPGHAVDFYNAVTHGVYESLIGLGKWIHLKQFFQPEFTAGVEIGERNVLASKAMVYGKKFMPKAWKEELKAVEKQLYPEKLDFTLLDEAQRAGYKLLSNAMGFFGKPGMWAFTKMDKMNREQVFIAASKFFDQSMKKGNLDQALNVLLPAQKNMVVSALKKGGEVEARRRFGLIQAQRHNYAYSITERAEIASGEVMKRVPFVTWGSNQWNRLYQRIRQKQGLTLAKSMAYPYVGIVTLQHMFNQKFYPSEIKLPGGHSVGVSGFHPVSSMMPLMSQEGMPGPLTMLEAVVQGDGISAIKLYKRLKPKRKRKQQDDLTSILSIR